ncbi:MAG: YicC family protein [Gemmatimonadetes bacterium]|nr:YicC family protein [Gemmatimonadota bacterium]
MTGFGEAEHALEDGVLRVQLKTVNHRFLNTSVRTPAGFDRIETQLQGWIRKRISRGHVSVSITLDRGDDPRDDLPEVDLVRAGRIAAMLRSMRDELGLEGDVGVPSMLRFNEIFATPSAPERDVVDPEAVRAAVDAAARAVVDLREVEGARLRADMEGRLDTMSALLDRVEQRAPERLGAELERLRARVTELAAGTDVDQDRLAREIAYLAEKWDINEEIVRFRSHIALFRETFQAEEPVGKRLSFIVQEMHREANTVGSKANDVAIGHAAVAMKEEIERLREQVENVE